MRISAIRMAIVAALFAAFALVGTASASAATPSCATSGTIKLSPGLTNEATVQNVQIKGTLSGCGEETGVTTGKFQIHFKTAEPIDCATLASEGVGAAAEENSILIKWKKVGNSHGTASVPITEVPNSPLTGAITSGPFEEGAVSGALSESYTGGPTCGVVPEGKKKAKKVNKGTFSGTLSVS